MITNVVHTESKTYIFGTIWGRAGREAAVDAAQIRVFERYLGIARTHAESEAA